MADQLSVEQKILEAAQIAEQAVNLFNPAAAALIQSGVAVEPVFSGIVHLIIGLIKHKASQPSAPAASAPAAS